MINVFNRNRLWLYLSSVTNSNYIQKLLNFSFIRNFFILKILKFFLTIHVECYNFFINQAR